MADAPDYFIYNQYSSKVAMIDQGELAVRLGSLDVYDRRGKVIWWYDPVQHGKGFLHNGTTTTIYPYMVWDHTLYRGASLAVKQIRASADNIYLQRYLVRERSGRIGFEVGVTLPEHFGVLDMSIRVSDELGSLDGTIRFDGSDGYVKVQNPDLSWSNLCEYSAYDELFNIVHQVKLAVDFDQATFFRLFLDGVDMDLTTYELLPIAVPDVRFMLAQLAYTSAGDPTEVLYVHYAILTEGEY